MSHAMITAAAKAGKTRSNRRFRYSRFHPCLPLRMIDSVMVVARDSEEGLDTEPSVTDDGLEGRPERSEVPAGVDEQYGTRRVCPHPGEVGGVSRLHADESRQRPCFRRRPGVVTIDL